MISTAFINLGLRPGTKETGEWMDKHYPPHFTLLVCDAIDDLINLVETDCVELVTDTLIHMKPRIVNAETEQLFVLLRLAGHYAVGVRKGIATEPEWNALGCRFLEFDWETSFVNVAFFRSYFAFHCFAKANTDGDVESLFEKLKLFEELPQDHDLAGNVARLHREIAEWTHSKTGWHERSLAHWKAASALRLTEYRLRWEKANAGDAANLFGADIDVGERDASMIEVSRHVVAMRDDFLTYFPTLAADDCGIDAQDYATAREQLEALSAP